MKKSLLILSVGTSFSMMFTGCATMFGGGGNQLLNIKSDREIVVDIYKVAPKDPNAEENEKVKEPVLLHKNIPVPTSITVDRSNNDLLLKPVNSECPEEKVEKKLNNWFWGDVLATSLLSTTVDAVTGAMWEYDKEVTMECNN